LRKKEAPTRESWKLIETKAIRFLNKINPSADWDGIINGIQI
jgi:hypothetical protein